MRINGTWVFYQPWMNQSAPLQHVQHLGADSRQHLRGILFFGYHPLPPPLLDLFILLDLRSIRVGSTHSKGVKGGLGLLLAEATEKRDVVAEHGVVGAGMLDGGVEFAFYAGDGLEKELAEVAEGGCGLLGDAFFG